MTYNYRADPILGGALTYWTGKRGTRPMPARSDLDPADIPELLPNLQLVDVIEHGRRFRYRLVGTAIAATFGRDYTAKFVDEQFSGDRRHFIEGVYRAVCDHCGPMFLRNRYRTTRDFDIVANRLYLPLSGDGKAVDIILGACTFEYASEASIGMWGSANLDHSDHSLETVHLDRPD